MRMRLVPNEEQCTSWKGKSRGKVILRQPTSAIGLISRKKMREKEILTYFETIKLKQKENLDKQYWVTSHEHG